MDINAKIITATEAFVKQELTDAEGGHDWFHVLRVYKNALLIGQKETANMEIVTLGALLHDIADSKFYGGDETVGPKKAKEFLNSLHIADEITAHVLKIIQHISFKGGNEAPTFRSSELDIVQDADRLDAMGAIGIARAFNYGGFRNRTLYDPEISPNLKMTSEEYKVSKGPTINHFYEKLLLLKDCMNTKTGKGLAERRHEYMKNFLQEFYAEWEGKG